MPTNKTGPKKEGGIDLKSDRAEIAGSVAGRDNVTSTTGLSGEDVNQIIETLLKYFPKGYLQNPSELDKTLNDFRLFHEQLHEYKELHNAINDILVAFEPFKAEIDRANSSRSLPKLNRIRDLWRPVSMCVADLLKWSQSIKNIGVPFASLENNSKVGEPWAVEFSQLQGLINEHLGMTEQVGLSGYTKNEIDYPSQVQIMAYQRFGKDIHWWEKLSEFTSSFQNVSSRHMNAADKQLREKAQELYNLSNRAIAKIS